MLETTKLTVRKLDMDLAECIKKSGSLIKFINDSVSLPGGVGMVLDMLATSIFVEFGETQIIHYKRLHRTWGTEGGENLILQEAAHGAYHHVLNQVIEPTYLKFKTIPMKVNKLLYPFLAPFEDDLKKLVNPSSPEEKAESLKKSDFNFAAFETTVGVFRALAFFELLEKHFDHVIQNGKNNALLYLWTYHYTEELEHSYVALNEFEQKYGEVLYSPENMPRLLHYLDTNNERVKQLMYQIGLNVGIQLAESEISELPVRRKVAQLRKEYANGFIVEDYAKKREHYIELYDKKWAHLLAESLRKWQARADAA